LLPGTSPEIPGYDIAGKSLAARNVGGDFFDFIRTDESRWAVCLGDVSGKGLPASLLMANLQATIRQQCVLGVPMRECLSRSNTLLYQTTDPEKFATVFYGILDVGRHIFRFSNGGHNPPLLLASNKESRMLETGGPALGLFTEGSYEEEEIPFRPGDLLVIYSDGVTDAIDETEEQYGEERLMLAVEENATRSAEGLVERILESVNLHAGNSPQLDDMTLVVVKRING
jgi:sigma-B regulation protein RsbU (phosphoserine phosphatase)